MVDIVASVAMPSLSMLTHRGCPIEGTREPSPDPNRQVGALRPACPGHRTEAGAVASAAAAVDNGVIMADTDAHTLLPQTEAWLRAVPGLSYPQALVTQFPRIANQLAEVRHDPEALRAAFHELLHDHRGSRRGFPFEVLMNLMALREALVKDDTPPEVDDATKWVS